MEVDQQLAISILSLVNDEELLYRCILAISSTHNDQHYKILESGEVRISSSAFNDRGRKPSVDIASINKFDARKSQLNNPTSGVVALLCGDVRKIGKNMTYEIDVIHRPNEDNPAHAQIESSPDYDSDRHFKKVKEKLAKLASDRVNQQGWAISPCQNVC